MDLTEKIVTGMAGLFTLGLGIWAKITFVRRSELYHKDGQPIYQHADGCEKMQASCNKLICGKIDELKKAQLEGERKRDAARREMYDELGTIKRFMGAVDQYIKDHD